MLDTMTWFLGVGFSTGVGWYLGQAIVDFLVGVLFEGDEDG